MSDKNLTKIGLIGAGEFGNFAGSVIDMLDGFTLGGVVDTNEKSAVTLAKKYGSKVFTNYKDLLKYDDIEIVVINVPNNLHAKITCDALEAGKKVLCEKPLGINQNELDMVGKTLKKTKGILLVNYLLPRSSIYKKLSEDIKANGFGKLKYAYIENLATESTIKSDWYWDDRKSGGWFLTADIHFYDLFCHLFGSGIDLIDAKEYKKVGRTCALYTALATKDARVDVFHDFSAGYERVGFKARFIFEKADIDISGWIPVEMNIGDSSGGKRVRESEDRELIYQKLVAENISDLGKITHRDSLKNFARVCASSSLAFSAQKIAKRSK